MIDLHEELNTFLEEFQDKNIAWGEDDCSAWPALWASRRRGGKIVLPNYSSEAEAHALIERAGSLCAVWEDIAARIGVFETTEPKCGDIAIIEMGAIPQMGAIFGEGGIALLRATYGPADDRKDGIRPIRPYPRTIVKAWAI